MEIEDPSYYQTNPLFGSAPLNRLISAWFHAPESNYIPITWNITTLLAEFTDSNPRAFHAFALFLHLSNCVLAFFLLRRLRFSSTLAAIAVLIFSLHPLRVESVAWASSIKGLLASLFALGALVAQCSPTLRFRSSLVILLLLASLLSKQTLLLLPIIHFLISLAHSEHRLKKFSYIALTILSLLAVFAASKANSENTLVAINQLQHGSFAPLKALASFGHYLKLQLLPFPLIPEYPSTRHPGLVLLGVIGLIPLIPLLKNLFLSKPQPLWLVFFVGFLILLSPTLGLIPTPLEFTADRLTYLSSLFFWSGLLLLLSKIPFPTVNERVQKFAPLFSLLLLAPFLFLTHRQIKIWKSDTLLTESILHNYPNHFLANLHLANKLGKQGKFTEALPYAQILTREHPHRYGGWKTFSEINIHLGQPEVVIQSLDQRLTHSEPITPELYLLRGDPLRALG